MGLIGACLGGLYLGFHAGADVAAGVSRAARALAARRSTSTAARSRRRPTSPTSCAWPSSPTPNSPGWTCHRWRLAFNGAEPVSPDTLERFASRFARCGFRREALTPVYGLAESSVGLAFPPLGRGPLIDRGGPASRWRAIGIAAPARRRRRARPAHRHLRPALARPRASRRRRRRLANCREREQGRRAIPRPVQPRSGYLTQPRRQPAPVRRRLARTPATWATSPAASCT